MRRAAALPALALALLAPAPAVAAPEDFGIESVDAALSMTQAGAHPDLTFTVDIKQDPESEPNPEGLRDAYAVTRHVRFELPPGLVGDPNALGPPQQCTVENLFTWQQEGGGCPNGSQVGVTEVFTYADGRFTEPVYMMAPPGGEVVARLGFIAAVFPTFIDLRVRSESDYGLTAEVNDASTEGSVLRIDARTWGIPANPSHDTERCTPKEVIEVGCVVSPPRPPGSRPLPFMTNPTRCGVPLQMSVSAASWVFPEALDTKTAAFPAISGCDKLPFGPDLAIVPTSQQAEAPTGLDVTVRLAGPDGVNVLEPSHMRDIEVTLPEGMALNPGAADGLDTCSAEEVRFGTREAASCPDAAKIASAEFQIPSLPRRMRGAIYLRDPQPGNLFRAWIVADDLGAHVKLPAELEVAKDDGQITSLVLDVPQFPLRESKLIFFPGSRAPLVNPPSCGTHESQYTFRPWSGTPPLSGGAPMQIDPQSCAGSGGFAPELASAGTIEPSAGHHSPFLFTLTRRDAEQNPASLDLSLPPGLLAKLAGIRRCEGEAAATGHCPPASRIGTVKAATGYGTAPLWVPQPGKDPTAVYLAGPYKGAPFSVIAVVPAQAGPFDLGDVVVRSAIRIDPEKARATVASDPLPQIIEGIPVRYRTIHVELDREEFALNPTSCKQKQISAHLTSAEGAEAEPTAPFQATSCAALAFKPRLFFRLFGATQRGAHPKLRVILKARPGDANIAHAAAILPRSAFLEQAHIRTVCTRVQFAADSCPSASIYGHARAITPLLDKPLKGPVYLRSSDNLLPDLVAALSGEVEVDLIGRIDSVGGGLRSTFEAVPDAPVSKFILTMQGGRKGLLVNSRDLCRRPSFAAVALRAQNGRRAKLRPQVRSACGKQRGRHAR